jgi:uncharacterized protein involved in exopolysaccharide biosynthesis
MPTSTNAGVGSYAPPAPAQRAANGAAASGAASPGEGAPVPPAAPRPLLALLRSDPWRSAIAGAVLFAVLGVTYWLFAPRTYAARAVVAPSARPGMARMPSSLSGLAGQLGLGADQDATGTPAFYSLLSASESIQREVFFSSIRTATGELVPVWRTLRLEPCDSACLLREGIPKLKASVDVVVDRQTGTFEVSAILRDPVAAASLVNAYIAALDRYNRQVRQTQTRASREFLEGRVAAVEAQLRRDEDELEGFYEGHVAWEMAPRRRTAEGRMRRRADARTELLTTLNRQLESARLDEVNATPLLNVIDAATPPLRKHSPRGLLILIASTVSGGFLGLVVGLTRARA